MPGGQRHAPRPGQPQPRKPRSSQQQPSQHRPRQAVAGGSPEMEGRIADVIGPVIAGAIDDRTQSYNHLLWALIGVLFIVGCLYALVVKPSKIHEASVA